MGELVKQATVPGLLFNKKPKWINVWGGLLKYNRDKSKLYFTRDKKEVTQGTLTELDYLTGPVYLSQAKKPSDLHPNPVIVAPTCSTVVDIKTMSIMSDSVTCKAPVKFPLDEYMYKGRTAVEYDPHTMGLNIVNLSLVLGYGNSRKLNVFELNPFTGNTLHRAGVVIHEFPSYNNGQVIFIGHNKLLIVASMGHGPIKHVFSIIDLNSGTLQRNNIVSKYGISGIPAIKKINNKIHLFELSTQNKSVTKSIGDKSIYVHSLKSRTVGFAGAHNATNGTVELWNDDGVYSFDLSICTIEGLSKEQRTKQPSLYKKLQRSHGGVNPLVPTRVYVVEVPANKRNFFIENFGIGGDWIEDRITITTTELSAGSRVSVSFVFNEKLTRDFIVPRDVWDSAFVKKESKHKLVMDNQVLQSLKKIQ